eukprot:TRINITY_DN8714_c0_g1_i1.p1 TRINITY_DN8714_c0_g1~~TRINITY_DN8714_c0_g1_i1.p1  ORF type:complete len:483 (+),score=75.17 TRINITY_DN8714_c0_g1_i1:74-1522(+)
MTSPGKQPSWKEAVEDRLFGPRLTPCQSEEEFRSSIDRLMQTHGRKGEDYHTCIQRLPAHDVEEYAQLAAFTWQKPVLSRRARQSLRLSRDRARPDMSFYSIFEQGKNTLREMILDASATLASSPEECIRRIAMAKKWTSQVMSLENGEGDDDREERFRVRVQTYMRIVDLAFLQHDDYSTHSVRRCYKTLLLLPSKWKTHLAFEPCLVSLLGMLSAIFRENSKAFRAFTCIYNSLNLDDYYMTPSAIPDDVQLIWAELQTHFPLVTECFARYDKEDVFNAIVEEWLKSAFAVLCPFEQEDRVPFLRLIQFVISKNSQRDPRYALRHAVVCIFVRHLVVFEAAQSWQEVDFILTRLRANLFVDDVLMSLLDTRFSSSLDSAKVAAMLPIGGYAGWHVGLLTGNAWLEPILELGDTTGDALIEPVISIGGALMQCFPEILGVVGGAMGIMSIVALSGVTNEPAEDRARATIASVPSETTGGAI